MNYCPICNNHMEFRLRKESTDYFQCTSCLSLLSEPLENSNMVGGGSEIPRNTEQNHLRIARIDNAFRSRKKENVYVLDFGCGTGYLRKDLITAGYRCDGYDAYNEEFSKLPEKNKYNVVTCIECIEHTSSPYVEIDVMYRALVPGGLLMIESSFVNVAWEEKIELEDFFYISPSVGHASIFSHHGLDVLLCRRGFIPVQHWDRHVRAFVKQSK